MIKFPKGMANYYDIITEDYFYVDRTSYIPLLEQAGKALLFLRPRRFGKSLLLSMLENFYDVAKAHEFESLFGHLAIGQNSTAKHNQYFVMTWDFSVVNAQGQLEEIKQSLHNHLNKRIKIFAARYRDFLPESIQLEASDAIASFEDLLAVLQLTPYKLYLLIDEYDHFANTVMMSSLSDSKQRYETLVQGEGLLKTVFKVVSLMMVIPLLVTPRGTFSIRLQSIIL